MVDKAVIGRYEIDAPFRSGSPREFICSRNLWVCEHCLKSSPGRECSHRLQKHGDARVRHRPGREIYREANASVCEVSGSDAKRSCLCQCLLSTLFLEATAL
jgi:hypothetical protein